MNDWPKLGKAISDAQEIAGELEERGFQVTFKKDLDSAGMQKALKEFFALKGADPEARLFLWYTGHGHTLKDEGFLVPVDAPPPTSPPPKLKAIKSGKSYRFAFRAANTKGRQDLGKVEGTVKDGFKRVGMFIKTWGSEPIEVSFSNFTILPGAWN